MSIVYESYTSGDNTATGVYGAQWGAQTYTSSVTHTVARVRIKAYRFGSPGTVTIGIRAVDGSGLPTGADLASGTVDGDTFTTIAAGEWYSIDLGGGYDSTADTKYAIVARATAGDASNYIGWRVDNTSPTYTGGEFCSLADSGSSWIGLSGTDTMFEEWGVFNKYEVCVDWNNDGDFVDTYDDISADVMSLKISRGRDDELESAEVGKCGIQVRDTAGKYVPENTAGVLYGSLLPGRPVRIRAFLSGTRYNLFFGFIDDIIPSPKPSAQSAYIPCVDGVDQLNRSNVTMALQTSKTSGQLFTTALDYVSWNATRRTLDTGPDTYPLVHAEKQKCGNFLRKIEQSEFGFMYIGADGYLNWEDRHHRLKSPHTTSQWTCTASHYSDINPVHSLKSIRNRVVVKSTYKTLAAAPATVIWTLQENKDNSPADSPTIKAGETITYWAKYYDGNNLPCIAGSVVTPVSTTDYLGNDNQDGSGADRTADISITDTIFAGSAKLEVQNTSGTNLYLTFLQIRGQVYSDSFVQVEEDDATSQTAYGLREIVLDLPYYHTTSSMQGIAEYMLALKKDPRNAYDITLWNKDDTVLAEILGGEISERITLQSSTLNIDDDYFIERMEHTIDLAGKRHKCVWRLTNAEEEAAWVLDASLLDTSTRLAY
ncbi:MAG: hypothetical protein SVK08_00605 [Halobacteriota archaeon]|nr:hypothetical protein [Halobacteriota archaeon]